MSISRRSKLDALKSRIDDITRTHFIINGQFL